MVVSESEKVSHVLQNGVGLKDRKLFVNGRSGSELKGSDERTFYTEWKGDRLYRELSLPCEVDANSLLTELKDGVLTLTMKRAAGSERKRASAKSA